MKEFLERANESAKELFWNIRTYWVMWLTGFLLAFIIVSCTVVAAENREAITKLEAETTPEERLAQRFQRHLDDQFGVVCYIYDQAGSHLKLMDCVPVGQVVTYRPANEVSKENKDE